MWTRGPTTFHLVPSDALPAPVVLHLEIAALAELRSPGSGRARFAEGGPGQAEQEVGYAMRLASREELGRYGDPRDPGLPDPAREEVWVLAAIQATPRFAIVDGATLRRQLEEVLAADPRAREPFAREKGAAPYLPLAARYDGRQTLAALADTCETCGGRAEFTGRAEARGREVHAVLHCSCCQVDFPVWSRATEPLLAAWQAATLDAPDRLRLRDALRVLRGGSGTEALIRAAGNGRRLPWLGAEEVQIAPESSEPWVRLVLESCVWVPAPARRSRILEAMAFVCRAGAGASALSAHLRQAEEEDIAWAMGELRFRPCASAAAVALLLPMFEESPFPRVQAAGRRWPNPA